MQEPILNMSQQHKLFAAEAARSVTLIGAGSVGSHVAIALAKLGVTRMTVMDGDYVESHNIPMSEYRLRDLARPKVDALKDIVKDATGIEIEACPTHYTGGPLSGAVICCVDTMEARQLIWEQVRMCPTVDILIDTRTNAELVKVFAIAPCDPEDVDFFEYFLRYSSKDAEPAMCGKHGTKVVAMRAASAVCADLTSWWQHGRKKRHHAELAGDLESIE